MWTAEKKVDASGHAVTRIFDDAATGWGATQSIELTPHEAEKLIKQLRKCIDSCDAHNRTRSQRKWP